jgi:hypothetical protein
LEIINFVRRKNWIFLRIHAFFLSSKLQSKEEETTLEILDFFFFQTSTELTVEKKKTVYVCRLLSSFREEEKSDFSLKYVFSSFDSKPTQKESGFGYRRRKTRVAAIFSSPLKSKRRTTTNQFFQLLLFCQSFTILCLALV